MPPGGGSLALWQIILAAMVGLGLLGLLWRLLNPPPRLEIGERGILDRGLGWGWIPWEEIEGAYPPTLDEADSVRLRLRVTERLARALQKNGRPHEGARDSLEIRLDLSDTKISAVDVLQEILAHPDGPGGLAAPGREGQ